MYEELGEMTSKDYEAAKNTVDALVSKLGINDGNILDILKTAMIVDGGDTEANGSEVEAIDENGNIIVLYRGRLAVSDLKWIRIEQFKGEVELMYIYLPIEDGKINIPSISFDIYPNPDTDSCWENVCYGKCASVCR